MDLYVSNDKTKLAIEKVIELIHSAYWATEESEDTIRASVQNSECYCVYKKENSELIGFARVITDYATTCYICDVIVKEEYRGQDVGTALMDAIVSDRKYEGMRTFLLTRTAHGFYEHFGFERDDVLLMYKK